MATSFEINVNNPDSPLIHDLSYCYRPLLIAFGGMAGALGVPPFEFFKLTKDLEINKIFLRDLNQVWYHAGIQGITKNIDDTASYVKRLIRKSKITKIYVFGGSMGGYAAILFGTLIDSDVIHAFAPQTCLHNDEIIGSKNRLKHLHNNFSKKYFDLKKIIESSCSNCLYNIYYDSNVEADKKHAEHIEYSRNVTLHQINEGGHNLIKILRDSGRLQGIIISAINSTPT